MKWPKYMWLDMMINFHRGWEGGDAEDGDPRLHAPPDRGDAGGSAEPGEAPEETFRGEERCAEQQPAQTHGLLTAHELLWILTLKLLKEHRPPPPGVFPAQPEETLTVPSTDAVQMVIVSYLSLYLENCQLAPAPIAGDHSDKRLV